MTAPTPPLLTVAELADLRAAVLYSYEGGAPPADLPPRLATYAAQPDGGLVAAIDLATGLATRVAELEAQQRRHAIALGRAWDDGNATGLDGWVGPGRGEEVDDEAVRARERAIEAGLGGPVGDPESDWQDWADDLAEASARDAFRAGWHAAHGTTTQEGRADA